MKHHKQVESLYIIVSSFYGKKPAMAKAKEHIDHIKECQ